MARKYFFSIRYDNSDILMFRLNMDYIKNVVNPIRQVAPRDSLRGFKEKFGQFAENVLYLQGEIHYERKPVS